MQTAIKILLAIPIIGAFIIGSWMVFFWMLATVIESINDWRHR